MTNEAVSPAPPGLVPSEGAPPPLVSILISNFNYGRFLADSIESALAQDHPRVEVVVVDDASSDGSQDVVRSYAGRVKTVLLARNGGQAAAINAGYAASQGEIVIFLDADDYLYPHTVATVVANWAPGISKVQYRLDLVDGEGNKFDLFPAREVSFDSGDVVPRLLSMGRYETVVTSGNAFARRALEAILPVPEEAFRLCADGYLVTVAPFHGPVVSLDEPLGAYRRHGANAWGDSGMLLPERLRRSLEHDAHRYRALNEQARRLALEVSPSLGMRDHEHLSTRLASLCLDRRKHPHLRDSRKGLAMRGALSSLDARLPWSRRAALATWFLAVGFLPRRIAAPAVSWRLAPSSRPRHLARILKATRRIAG